ncbi:ISNCY family transposase, partial [Noviherbaspirillum sp. 17J57-3]|nr:ISNCY family transposase [Noviherbaspirillum galbum]
FAKPPRNDWNAHRPLLPSEDLDTVFTWREQRKVSHVLTLQYDKTIYLIEDTRANRKLIGKYIDIYEYPDGRIEFRAAGVSVPYVTYDRLPQVDQGAIVENKRLGHVLEVVQAVQQQRDDRRSQGDVPARTNRGQRPAHGKAVPGKKRQRQLDAQDVERALRSNLLH